MIAAQAWDHVRPADTAVLAIINVFELRPSEIQKEAKLTSPTYGARAGRGERSALRSIALPARLAGSAFGTLDGGRVDGASDERHGVGRVLEGEKGEAGVLEALGWV